MSNNILDVITIGSDPEMCVFSHRENRIVSAIPLLPDYGKDNRLKLGHGIEVFPDNVNLEATIPPSHNKTEFLSNVRNLSAELDTFLSELDCEAHLLAAHNYCMERDLNTEEAYRFGCRPELVVYPDQDGRFIEYDRPDPIDIGTLRVCGGHLHIGRSDWETADPEAWLIEPWSKVMTARALDLFVGVVLTFLSKDPSSPDRKALYGRAGSMRHNLPYGLEYRTLDNFWLSSPETIELIYDLVVFSVTFAEANRDLFKTTNDVVNFARIQEAINTGNKSLCLEIINESPLPDDLKQRIHQLNDTLVFNPVFKYV